MKRKKNLYPNIIDIRKIQYIYNRRVKLNTKNKRKLEVFDQNYVSNMTFIKNLLEERKYVPGKYNIFLIKEPKVRIIMSQNIIDKIINHVVSEYILKPIFEVSLIDSNVATRENKGTHYGIKLIKKYINEIRKDGDFYILKFDISKYFFNINHDVVKELIRKKIKDKDAIKILDDILDSTNETYVNEKINYMKQREIEKIRSSNNKDKQKLIMDIERLPNYKYGAGLPIGNMTSQIIAIMYLDELDHYIKEELKIKYYIRYMDDGVILCKDKEYLKYCLRKIEEMVKKYKLSLNNKTKIYKSRDGFNFLGFRYIIKNNRLIVKVINQTKKKFKRKIKKMHYKLEHGEMDYAEYKQVVSSYIGHMNYANAQKLEFLNLGKEIKEYKN